MYLNFRRLIQIKIFVVIATFLCKAVKLVSIERTRAIARGL